MNVEHHNRNRAFTVLPCPPQVPFLILGNKIDLPGAASEEELRHYLGLGSYTTGGETLIVCSFVTHSVLNAACEGYCCILHQALPGAGLLHTGWALALYIACCFSPSVLCAGGFIQVPRRLPHLCLSWNHVNVVALLFFSVAGKGKGAPLEPHIRPIEVFMCSVVRRMGYGEGFRWVSQYIK